MIDFPNIDPVIIELGPLAIRWYSLAYVIGIVGGAWYISHLNKRPPTLKNLKPFDDLLIWGILGIIIGGRLGFTLFYYPGHYLTNPLDIFKIWEGGMSFHGGFTGFAIGLYLFSRKYSYSFLTLSDLCACAAPIGLFLGRIANFINGELYGRVTDSNVPWEIIFPNGGPYPRHPSQIYEALLEGIVTFVILLICSHIPKIKEKPGFLTGIFLCCYAISRIIVEVFREPDAQLGFIIGNATMGQLLSMPMLILGLYLIGKATRKPTTDWS